MESNLEPNQLNHYPIWGQEDGWPGEKEEDEIVAEEDVEHMLLVILIVRRGWILEKYK